MRKLLLILLLLGVLSDVGARRYALVIGIGDYPANSGWHKINGDKDIPLVEEMLTANGFSKTNIVELKNQQATCVAICRELENLIAKSQTGDYVYIHFSGHGQQITDLNGDEIIDHKDEAWIPYDAQFAIEKGKYEGEYHIVDDQLNSYLHRLRHSIGAEGKIIVVSDACHSGDITRHYFEDDKPQNFIEGCRGTKTAFIIDNIKHAINRISKSFKKEQSVSIDRSHIEHPSVQNTELEWIHISACQSDQVNQEYKGQGSLTTILFMYKDSLNSLSIKELRKKAKTFYDQFFWPQSPQFEGPINIEKDTLF